MKKWAIIRYIPAMLELIGLWVVIWLWYFAALAMNNFVQSGGMVLAEPAMWFVLVSRYHLTVVAGLLLSALIVVKEVKRGELWHNVISLGFLLLLLLSSLGLTAFAITVGGCLCDQWQSWQGGEHSVESSSEIIR
ncbi:MAG: hypothetical protein OEM02_15540 [Desulfobulbaceae bacterium]|nr:hypothetical protein [Desulfobulbaceae bacterium]